MDSPPGAARASLISSSRIRQHGGSISSVREIQGIRGIGRAAGATPRTTAGDNVGPDPAVAVVHGIVRTRRDRGQQRLMRGTRDRRCMSRRRPIRGDDGARRGERSSNEGEDGAPLELHRDPREPPGRGLAVSPQREKGEFGPSCTLEPSPGRPSNRKHPRWDGQTPDRRGQEPKLEACRGTPGRVFERVGKCLRLDGIEADQTPVGPLNPVEAPLN